MTNFWDDYIVTAGKCCLICLAGRHQAVRGQDILAERHQVRISALIPFCAAQRCRLQLLLGTGLMNILAILLISIVNWFGHREAHEYTKKQHFRGKVIVQISHEE
jgi:hypothetical protein